MSAFLYDGVTSTIAALVAVGAFLISRAVLDVVARLIIGLLVALSPSFKCAAQVHSALAAMCEHYQRR